MLQRCGLQVLRFCTLVAGLHEMPQMCRSLSRASMGGWGPKNSHPRTFITASSQRQCVAFLAYLLGSGGPPGTKTLPCTAASRQSLKLDSRGKVVSGTKIAAMKQYHIGIARNIQLSVMAPYH